MMACCAGDCHTYVTTRVGLGDRGGFGAAAEVCCLTQALGGGVAWDDDPWLLGSSRPRQLVLGFGPANTGLKYRGVTSSRCKLNSPRSAAYSTRSAAMASRYQPPGALQAE